MHSFLAVIVRFLFPVLLALLWPDGEALAQAAEPITHQSCFGFSEGCTMEQANRACQLQVAIYNSNTGGGGVPYSCRNAPEYSPRHFGIFDKNQTLAEFRLAGSACVAPQTWDQATGQCVDKNQECLARNGDLGLSLTEPQPRTWTSRCVSGCNLEMQSPSCTTVSGMGQVCRGTLSYTGTCPANTPPGTENDDDPKSKECTPAPGGNTFCVKGNGDHCYSASNGRQICWPAGQTGTKTDGDVAQKRTPGTDPQTPPTPPENTTLTPGTPTTTTNTTPGKPTIITTTINYTTNTGTDAGDNNDGENTDGEEDGTGVNGGQDCNTPPACMDNREAVGCAILLQTWKNRCETGIPSTGYTLPGADQSFVDENSDDPSKLGPGTTGTGNLNSHFSDNGAGTDMSGINDNGWASRGACPIDLGVDIRFGFYSLPDTHLCAVLDALAALVLLAGYLGAAFIIHGQYSSYMAGRS